MNWLNRAEVRFGHLAIEGLPRILVSLNALVFILFKVNPTFLGWLQLELPLVRHGEVWRLITYIFIPSFGGVLGDWLSVICYLWFQWWVGCGLEDAIGSFKFNVFFLLGMIGTTLAAWITGIGFFSNIALYNSIFFGFAWYYPETWIYLMMIVPVKVKWLAWFTAAVTIFFFLLGSWPLRLALAAAFANYFLFFGPEIAREALLRKQVSSRRRQFDGGIHTAEAEALHSCVICGRTELNAPELEFRVTKDGHEYCREHLPKQSAPPSA